MLFIELSNKNLSIHSITFFSFWSFYKSIYHKIKSIAISNTASYLIIRRFGDFVIKNTIFSEKHIFSINVWEAKKRIVGY